MSKRNLTLLIIVLIIIVIGFFAFLSSRNQSSSPGTSNPGTNFISNMLNFGIGKIKNQPNATSPANISGYVSGNTTTGISVQQKLTRVSTMPIAGFGVFMKERFVDTPAPVIPQQTATPPANSGTDSTSTKISIQKTITTPTPPSTETIPALRYVDKATGNIYETFADKINESQFSNIVIPKVYDAYFANNCASVLMRYLNDDGRTIETFIAPLPKEVLGEDIMADNQIKGSFLPENISNINISPDTSKLFYLFKIGNNDSSVGITADSAGNKKVQVFSSPLTEWLSRWPNNKIITLTTKPSSGVLGYMYAIDPDKKTLNKILGNIKGLTTLASPNGKLVLYSDDNLSLNIYNTDTKQSTSTGIKTLPEKCVWVNSNDFVYCAVPNSIEKTGYPDIWYQGQVSFSDQIWKIDAKNGTTNLISDLSSGGDIDGIKLALDDAENYLFFVNKKDSYLWELNLK